MLVLKRKIGETIILDGNIKVQLISIEGEGVKIGIEAPSHISILRGEIYEGILKENQEAQSQAQTISKEALQQFVRNKNSP